MSRRIGIKSSAAVGSRQTPQRDKSPCFTLTVVAPTWGDGSECFPDVGSPVTVDATELFEIPNDYPESWVRDGHLLDGAVHSRGLSAEGEPWLRVLFTDIETEDRLFGRVPHSSPEGGE